MCRSHSQPTQFPFSPPTASRLGPLQHPPIPIGTRLKQQCWRAARGSSALPLLGPAFEISDLLFVEDKAVAA